MHVYPNALVFAFLAAVAAGPLSAGRADRGGRNRVAQAVDDSNLSARLEVTQSSKPQSHPSSRLFQAVFHWLLGAAYLLATVICLQTMSSAFLRAMGDKIAEAEHLPSVSALQADSLYKHAVGIDPQNWRAYKGMGKLIYKRRYHCLDLDEKVVLAVEEKRWFERARTYNFHDPEILSSLGHCILFLSRTYETLSVESDAGLEKDGDDQPTLSKKQPMAREHLQSQGLELLREACRYRKFNDTYWWSLGVELRKEGLYEEALATFRYAEKLKRTPSVRKNIQWLEKQMAQGGAQQSKYDGRSGNAGTQSQSFSLKQEGANLHEILDLMETHENK
jgi:tetratricopeptide (TPR) repeat protein